MTEQPVYVETFRATVAPSDCDHLGHMNVQHYTRAISDGMYSIMIHLGLTPDEIRKRRIAFAAVRAQTEFHRELYAGDVIFLESTLVRIGTKSATFRHRLKNAATQEIVMTAEIQCALLDLNDRQAVVIPDDVRMAAQEFFKILPSV
jgi:acyl-CoA thioesterase FadM